MSTITLDEQIASVAREIGLRQRVYPRWVADKRMSQEKADHEIAAMQSVLATLIGFRAAQGAKVQG